MNSFERSAIKWQMLLVTKRISRKYGVNRLKTHPGIALFNCVRQLVVVDDDALRKWLNFCQNIVFSVGQDVMDPTNWVVLAH